jgi:FkbM family methyltransferase
MLNESAQEKHWNYTINEWSTEFYFKDVIDILKNNKIKTVIDIGANVGGVIQILMNEIPTIEHAYLFEPQKNNFNFLFSKFKDNKKITCLNCGIYYGTKYYEASQLENHIGSYTIEKNIIVNNENYKPTQEYFQLFELEFFNFLPIDFLKIDIEGGEYNIIENSNFLKNVSLIEIELHQNFNEEYFKKYLPNHNIIYYGMYNDYVNHVLLQLK